MSRKRLSSTRVIDIFEAYDKKCYVCKEQLGGRDSWHLDHVVARCIGGKDEIENLAPICLTCHGIKTDKGVFSDKSRGAKVKRVRLEQTGYKPIKKHKIPSRGFKQGTSPRVKDINDDLMEC
jgi:5-methylcytosine-specific restriction endonuclease McrA